MGTGPPAELPPSPRGRRPFPKTPPFDFPGKCQKTARLYEFFWKVRANFCLLPEASQECSDDFFCFGWFFSGGFPSSDLNKNIQTAPLFPFKISRNKQKHFAQTVCAIFWGVGGSLGGSPSNMLEFWPCRIYPHSLRSPYLRPKAKTSPISLSSKKGSNQGLRPWSTGGSLMVGA